MFGNGQIINFATFPLIGHHLAPMSNETLSFRTWSEIGSETGSSSAVVGPGNMWAIRGSVWAARWSASGCGCASGARSGRRGLPSHGCRTSHPENRENKIIRIDLLIFKLFLTDLVRLKLGVIKFPECIFHVLIADVLYGSGSVFKNV